MNKTDSQLQHELVEELRWDPRVNAAQIGVTVENGVVSLLGAVDTYADKWAAEAAVKRVGGVRSVAEELTVKVLGPHAHTDLEIAKAAQNALEWDVWVPATVTAKVEHGRISLEGQVDWNYQREAAERAVRHLTGVVSVINSVGIKAGASASEVKEKVQAALQRQATADGKSITVGTSGGTVTLSGNASCRHAIEDATNAAWAAPGVTAVVDDITMNG
jgi:VCBS repeat-containing protein